MYTSRDMDGILSQFISVLAASNIMFQCKGQTISKANYALLNSPKKRMLGKFLVHKTIWRFGRIKNTMNCFRDWLTFGASFNETTNLFATRTPNNFILNLAHQNWPPSYSNWGTINSTNSTNEAISMSHLRVAFIYSHMRC